MIHATVNGDPQQWEVPPRVIDVVEELTGDTCAADGTGTGASAGVAVALNRAVVPRSQWATTRLEAGDELELITAMQGG